MKTFLSVCLFFFSISLFAQYKAEDPVAVDDSVSIMQYGTVHINVLANDYDPEGLAIFINEVDEEDGFEISFQDSIVSIEALTYNDDEYANIRYEIENEAGEDDRAYIHLYFTDNPEVPNPVEDIIDLDCQTEVIVNLIENDEYSGSEELVITELTQSGMNEIEILADLQSVKITAGIYGGPFKFGYRVKENGGNEYVSKKILNSIYIRGNEDAPIGNPDSYSVNLGETKVLDVLSNDVSNSTLSIDTTGLPDYVQVVENQLNFICPNNNYSFQDLSFNYYAINAEGLKSHQTEVEIIVSDALRTPVAVDDVFEVDLADTLIFDVLQNDSNFMEAPLVLSDGSNVIMHVLDNSIQFGWNSFNYRCKNEGDDELSNEATVIYYLRPPGGIELSDVDFHIQWGDVLEFSPEDYNNVPDTIDNRIIDVKSIGIIHDVDSLSLQYECDNAALSEYLFDSDSITDQVIVTYLDFFDDSLYVYRQRFNILFDNISTYSFLDVNNFNIPVSPFGMSFSNIHKPLHQYIDAKRFDDYGYFLEQIKPWIAKEYDANENLTISADVYYANNFFTGAIVDDYTSEYDSKYFRTWEVTKLEIDSHIANYTNADYEMPEVILNWPAGSISYNGNIYEQADYVDVNQNLMYDPENGDYPKISGDKAILFVINDNRCYPGYPTGNSYADSLNMEIFGLVYAFDRPESDLFQNTFFIKYKVINKSNIDYSDFRFAQYLENSQFEWNDYIGCDTTLNTFYRYPFSQNQEQFTSSFTLLNQKMGKFLTFGDTDIEDQALYSNMMGTYGDPFYFWHPPLWANYAPLDYVFPGKIDDMNSWTNFTHEPYFIGSNGGVSTSEKMVFAKGESKYFEYAFSVNYHSDIDYFDFVNTALDRAAQLIECYQNDSVPGGGSFTGIEEVSNNSNTQLLLYPNPARIIIYVDGFKDIMEYSIYTLHGQLIDEGILENEISIEHLTDGFYLLQIRSLDGKQEWTSKFVKQ